MPGSGVNPRPLVPGPPINPARLIAGGVAVVVSVLGGMYYVQHRQHERRGNVDKPGSLSAWENRIQEARTPSRNADSTGAGLVGSRGVPLDGRIEPNRAQHRTIKTFREQEGSEPMFGENGSYLQPVPQKDRGDGLAYTKRHATVRPKTSDEEEGKKS